MESSRDYADIPIDKNRYKPGDETTFTDAIRFVAEQPWPIPEALVVKLASVGSIHLKAANAAQPLAAPENLATVMDAIEAGVSGVHFNATDEDGRRIGGAGPYRALIQPCRERFGDGFVADVNILRGATFEEELGPVLAGLGETAPLSVWHPRRWVEAAAVALEEHNCRPELVVHSSGEVEVLDRLLLKPGLVRQPYVWIILTGVPSIANRFHDWIPHPRAMCQNLVYLVERIREVDPAEQPFIIVCTAGRAASYLTTLAMIMGLHVRVGTEDTMWKYPHRNDVLTSNREAVEHTFALARLLGRRPATADEYRAFMGLPAREGNNLTPALSRGERA
jgi:3-keto-5-aminohexanoate cleavage enzyme